MFDSRASRRSCFNLKVGMLAGLFFSINSNTYATSTPPPPQHTKQGSSSSASTNLGQKEQEIKNQEQERVFQLGLKIMENFGCPDYTDLGLKALIEYLRGQEGFPDQKRTRVFFTPQEHARNLTGHFRLLNYTEKTDTPESKIRNSSKGYSEAFRALSKILNEDLYLSYGDGTDLKKIADDLDNPRSQYGSYFKSKIKETLNRLNSFSSVDHFNVGCRIQGEPKGKNKLQVQLTEKTASGDFVKVHLDEYMKRKTKKKADVVDSTVQRKVKPKEEVKPAVVTPKVEKAPVKQVASAPKPHSAQAAKPAPAKPTLRAVPIPKPTSPAPTPKPAEPTKPDVKPASTDHEAIISKYLSIKQSELGSYLDSGWKKEYEDLIGALVLNENRGLLTNFHKFSTVCSNLHTYTSTSQKVYFLKKFFKALAKVESGYNPRNETRESTKTKYRPHVKGLPEDVKGLPFIDHSCGMFQLSEEAALSSLDACKKMNYVNDVRIGYPDNREMTLKDKNSGVYHEYNGDVRRTILNPFRNTACALDIMESLLNRGSLYSSTQHWAGLRTQSNFSGSRSKLKAAVRAELPGC